MESEGFKVYSTVENLIVHKESCSEALYIDRSISKVTKKSFSRGSQAMERSCYGILGLIQLYASNYLILITQASYAARVKESLIYQITNIDLISLTSLVPESANSKKDILIISELKSLLTSKTFYFSYDYDLTLPVQKIASLDGPSKSLQKWERADEKFFWNKYLCESLIKSEAHEYILPVVNGYIEGSMVTLDGKKFDYIIISRRDKRRAGTRFNTRGLDDKGNAVNFVETEQILSYWDSNSFHIFSHLQIRGSIPLIWQQKPNLLWMPRPKISSSSKINASAAELHFTDLYNAYGSVSLINLIDKKGAQNMIGTIFTNLYELQKSKRLSYVWFDFHHECKNMKYENLKKLITEIDQHIEEFAWCEVKVNGSNYIDKAEISKLQKGVFRTNCMDCLDRTNVVQSVISRNLLLKQLAGINVGPRITGEAFQSFSGDLEAVFRDLWVKNADAMSLLYAGTPAQKTDFTKVGKRTVQGAISDGLYSVQRYVINNFFDGSKQNSIDLLLGKLVIYKGLTLKNKYWALSIFMSFLVTALIVTNFLASKSTGYGYWAMASLSYLMLGIVLKAYGSVFVDKPIVKSVIN